MAKTRYKNKTRKNSPSERLKNQCLFLRLHKVAGIIGL